jgi:hypothetical protein
VAVISHDSPPASWYEPDASWDDDDDILVMDSITSPEPWVVTHGWATWTCPTDTDD